MAVTVGNYTISVEQVVEKGMIWNVCVHKKGLFKRCNSSDWFLDERQANTFAKSLEERIRSDSNLDSLKNRKPGWTLVRPNR
jgi:hypothetical protein